MEGFSTLEVVEYVLLLAFALMLFLSDFSGEEGVSQIKAEDLALSVESISLLDEASATYSFGGDYGVDFFNQRIRVYDTSVENSGMDFVSLDHRSGFVENVENKKDSVEITKEDLLVRLS